MCTGARIHFCRGNAAFPLYSGARRIPPGAWLSEDARHRVYVSELQSLSATSSQSPLLFVSVAALLHLVAVFEGIQLFLSQGRRVRDRTSAWTRASVAVDFVPDVSAFVLPTILYPHGAAVLEVVLFSR